MISKSLLANITNTAQKLIGVTDFGREVPFFLGLAILVGTL